MGNTIGKKPVALEADADANAKSAPALPPKSGSLTTLAARQSYAKTGVTLVSNAECGALAGCSVALYNLPKATILGAKTTATLIGETATAAVVQGTVAAAVVDTVADKVFHEVRGKETWAGVAKRNTPGLVASVGFTFVTGAALSEALIAWAVYKVAKNTWKSVCDFADNRRGTVIDYQPAVAQMRAAFESARAKLCTKKAAPAADATANKA